MAKQTQIVVTDDIDGSPDATTMLFGIDGNMYSIDLSKQHVLELYGALEKFRDHGTRLGKFHVSAKHAAPVKAVKAAGVNRGRNLAIRAWAEKEGLPVSARGRIQESMIAKYDAAHNS